MRRFVALAGVLSVVALGATPVPSAPADSAGTASPKLRMGVSTPGVPYAFSDLDRFEADAGQRASLVGYYVQWTHADFDPAAASAIRARGSTPMITWEPWDPTKGLDQPTYRLANISSGAFDAYITRWAQQIKAWGQPLHLRFAHEMNGDWYPWSERVNGNSSGDYAPAWRHVRGIFRTVGADNVTWVWSPNVDYRGAIPLGGVYPGDADVDRVGVDGYNGGTALKWGGWLSFDQIFGPTLGQLRSLAAKPIIVAEVASAEAGGNKAAWIKDFFASLAKNGDIQSFVWFNWDKETDWRIESSAAAQAAFAAGAASTVAPPALTRYVPVAPARILDTRNGTGGFSQPVGPGQSIDVQVTGVGGVPATGVAAVVINVAVTQPSAASYLAAWPTGSPRPLTSNLNFTAGQTIPNLVVAKVGAGGKVSIYNGAGSAHVVADVAGWYAL